MLRAWSAASCHVLSALMDGCGCRFEELAVDSHGEGNSLLRECCCSC